VLRWQLDQVGERQVVALTGVLDENADLRPLKVLDGAVAIDLSGVRRISSTGVREWIDFMRALEGRCTVSLIRCSPASVTQLNLIANFRGPAQVESFIAPYDCAGCGCECEVLLDAVGATRGVPPVECPDCGTEMDFAELPERYLTFLVDQARTGRYKALA
jgi:ABC-type transporter Mla MlaB component